MINVTVKKRQNEFLSLKVKGHAGYAEEGSDIICAAVSALTINLVNSLDELTDASFELKEDDGLVEITFNDKLDSYAALLMNSYLLGIEDILSENADYINLIIKED